MPLCLRGKSVKLFTSISLEEGQLCRGGQPVFQRHRLSHSGPTTNRGVPATCGSESQRKSRCTLASNIYIYINSVPLYRTKVVVVLQRYQGGYQRVAAQGKCQLLEFFWGESTNICGDHAAPELELKSLACFEPIAWRLRSSGFDGSLCYGNGSGAPRAHTARPQLCRSTLTSFVFCAKASFKTVNETGTASAEKKTPKHCFGFQFECKVFGCVPLPQHKRAIGMLLLWGGGVCKACHPKEVVGPAARYLIKLKQR